MEDLDSLMIRDRACKYIAQYLNDGVVSLFVGAGVSQAVGLPNWETLTKRCAVRAEIDPAKLEGQLDEQDFEGIITEVERGRAFGNYAELVSQALYEDFPGITVSTCSTPLLIAIGALGYGRQRGGVKEIVSLNFDDVLESYFALHGYGAQSVTELPALLRNDRIRILSYPWISRGELAEEEHISHLFAAVRRREDRRKRQSP